MTHKIFITLFAVALMSSCGNSKSDSVTVDGDSIVMSMDTATALTDSVKPSAPAYKRALDSLASYETTKAFMQNSPHRAKYESGIIPAVMEQSLDYARRLLRSPYDHFLIVDKQTMRIYLFDKYGNEVKNYLMACSRRYGTKHARRDNRTPEGFFSAGGIYDSSDWLYTNDDGYTSPARGVYGPRFIRVKNPATTQVGIHGTSSPSSPGHRVSHGCIRLTNQNILDLVKYAKTGMPIIINPSDADQRVNKEEGYNVTQLTLYFSSNKVTFDEKKDKKKEAAKTDSGKEAESDSTAVEAPKERAETPAEENSAEKPVKEKTKADTTRVG